MLVTWPKNKQVLVDDGNINRRYRDGGNRIRQGCNICTGRSLRPVGSRPGGNGINGYCGFPRRTGMCMSVSLSNSWMQSGTAARRFNQAVMRRDSLSDISATVPPVKWARRAHPAAPSTGHRSTFAPAAVANENRYDTNSIPISDTDVARVNVIVAPQICNSLSAINNALDRFDDSPFHTDALAALLWLSTVSS